MRQKAVQAAREEAPQTQALTVQTISKSSITVVPPARIRPSILHPKRRPPLPFADKIIRPLVNEIAKTHDPVKILGVENFFQCGPNQYAEGDFMLGLRAAELHNVVKEGLNAFEAAGNSPIHDLINSQDILNLIHDPYNDIRSIGYECLVKLYQHKQTTEAQKKAIFDLYIQNCASTKNWNVVDCSAHHIVGDWLITKKSDRKALYALTESADFWEQRVGVVATLALIKKGEFTDILRIARYHLEPIASGTEPISQALARASLSKNPHNHLLHKAIGWMLREVGKKDQQVLNNFLSTDDLYLYLPTHTYSYALEKHSAEDREQFARKKRGNVFVKPE